MYMLPFLGSFITMFSTIILFPVMLCPVSTPENKSFGVYKFPFTLHCDTPPVTLHNSSTTSPGRAITMPGPSCALTVSETNSIH